MKVITSAANQKIKDILKLDDAKTRKEQKRFVIEGIHLVNEALKKGIVESVFITEAVYEKLKTQIPQLKHTDLYLIKEHLAKKIKKTVRSQDIFAICKIEDHQIDYKHNVLLLDRVRDPGNIGTLIRSAASFGFKTVISSPNSVSFYNDKVLRSTQGNLFQVNLINEYLMQTISDLKSHGYLIIGTQMHEEFVLLDEVKFNHKNKYALIIGNESQGISSEITDLLDENILIEMEEDVESLNAAVAGSIIMYQIKIA
jgi:TrmH family RNA methyltransferase